MSADSSPGADIGPGVDTGMSMDGGGNQACAPLGTPLQQGAAPQQRGDMAYGFDPGCGRVFMAFGDEGVPQMCNSPPSVFVDDFWVHDLAPGQWTQIEVTGTKPMRRARSVGAWDAMRGRFLVFGGRFRQGSSGQYTFLNDLWAFDPASKTWTELSAQGAAGGPGGRMNTTMVADPERDRIIVYGGGTTDFMQFYPDARTWAFDLSTNTWSELGLQTQSPPARLFHVAALDRRRGRLFAFTGGGADAFLATSFKDDMWYLDFASDSWVQVPTDSSFPAGRIKSVMETDHDRDRLIMFGGHDDTDLGNTNDLWSFDLATLQWNIQKAGDVFSTPARARCDFPATFTIPDVSSPERREAHLFVTAGTKALLFGGRTDCGIANDTWVLDLTSLTWTQMNDSFVGMTCARAGRSDCSDPNADMCG